MYSLQGKCLGECKTSLLTHLMESFYEIIVWKSVCFKFMEIYIIFNLMNAFEHLHDLIVFIQLLHCVTFLEFGKRRKSIILRIAGSL